MSFVRVKSRRKYEDVVAQIRERIFRGDFKPGSRISTEKKLIESLGVSQASLREAFRVLEADGLIYSQPGGGRFVRDIDTRDMFRATGRIGPLEKQEILHLLEARETIECKTAELAATRATAEDKNVLRSIVERMSSSESDSEGDLFDLDTQFHKQMAAASKNPIFVNWLDLSIGILRDTRQRTLKSTQRRELLANELKEIYDAVEKKNPGKAASAMKKHIRAIFKYIKSMPEECVPDEP